MFDEFVDNTERYEEFIEELGQRGAPQLEIRMTQQARNRLNRWEKEA